MHGRLHGVLCRMLHHMLHHLLCHMLCLLRLLRLPRPRGLHSFLKTRFKWCVLAVSQLGQVGQVVTRHVTKL